MKKLSFSFLIISILLAGIFISCKKESSFNGNKSPNEVAGARPPGKGKNYPPVANAGADQVITLPTNSVNLNGSSSTDPDNNITSYQWTKISGPSSFTIANANAVQTQVTNLIEGVYQFELKVTDAGGLIGKDVVQVTVNSEGSPPPPCTTNCGKIVFVSNRDGNYEIYTCNADGSNVTRVTNDPAADGDPVWSPDGTRIAFTKNDNLCIMDADASNVVQKTFTNDVWNPTWSPDGTRIAFLDTYDEVNYTSPANIKIMDLASGAMTDLPNTGGSFVYPSPAWSPDGTRIAFESDLLRWDIVSTIFTISPQGSGLNYITSASYEHGDFAPSWSPDGTRLSVTIQPLMQGAQSSIAVMNADGTGRTIIRTNITNNILTGTSWSPDGTRIAYTESNTIKWVAVDGSAGGTIVTNGWNADWKH